MLSSNSSRNVELWLLSNDGLISNPKVRSFPLENIWPSDLRQTVSSEATTKGAIMQDWNDPNPQISGFEYMLRVDKLSGSIPNRRSVVLYYPKSQNSLVMHLTPLGMMEDVGNAVSHTAAALEEGNDFREVSVLCSPTFRRYIDERWEIDRRSVLSK